MLPLSSWPAAAPHTPDDGLEAGVKVSTAEKIKRQEVTSFNIWHD